jgi:hypothetical protein
MDISEMGLHRVRPASPVTIVIHIYQVAWTAMEVEIEVDVGVVAQARESGLSQTGLDFPGLVGPDVTANMFGVKQSNTMGFPG